MKGVIIIPKFYENLWTPDYKSTLSVMAPLWYEIQKRFNFEIRFANKVYVDDDTDVVLMWAVPYHNRPGLIPGLLELNKRIKLIMWSGDLQCYGNKDCLVNKIKVFNRCDIILSQTAEYFKQMYPQFLAKNETMLHFFSPHERYINFKLNEKPIMKCLLSGSLNKEVYTFRQFIVNKKHSTIDYRPPQYQGDSYSNLLHSYYCGIATASIFKYVLAKYFEIPATGSLLFAEETEDFKLSGMLAHKHYIPITKENVLSVVDECLKNPNNYMDVREEGLRFVHENHSVMNRVDQFEKILYKVFN